MPSQSVGDALEVRILFTPAEQEALAAAASRIGLPVAELAHALVVYGVAALARGDAEIQRAVKGSRDASFR